MDKDILYQLLCREEVLVFDYLLRKGIESKNEGQKIFFPSIMNADMFAEAK